MEDLNVSYHLLPVWKAKGAYESTKTPALPAKATWKPLWDSHSPNAKNQSLLLDPHRLPIEVDRQATTD